MQVPKVPKIPKPTPQNIARYLAEKSGPEDVIGELFERVQRERLFDDSKTFVDMIPAKRIRKIRQEYELQRNDPDFDLSEFVSRHFYEFSDEASDYVTDRSHTPQQHVDELWPILTRRADKSQGSLLALPNDYVVPGGRFGEQFYWDSYFVMLGLVRANQWDLIEGMMKNFAYMLRKFGFIPTGNRTYFLSRSQPPFFSHMVKLLAKYRGRRNYLEYLPAMLTEYRFWMQGARRLDENHFTHRRVARMPGGEILNRYYDNKTTPRPESHVEDIATAADTEKTNAKVYLDLRAAAESGWDFSSRWMDDPNDLSTTRTTDIVPVDLNCLLYDLEKTIAKAYYLVKQKYLSKKFYDLADARAAAIQRYFYHYDDGFYYDYDLKNQQQTGRATLAAVFPLWSKIAKDDQAERVAQRIREHFLTEGGLLTTTIETGQQWDAPNGWAPLQYVTIEALQNYGFNDLAKEIKDRWVRINVDTYKRTGKMVEKYNVSDVKLLGGGGEYPLQDGFGWTNGVLRELMS